MNRILSLVKPRVLSIVLIVLGLLAVILAVASATIWRPSQTAVATLKPAATTAYVVTGDGVLNMVDSTVTITAKAKDANSTVTLALARSEDAQAWLANDPYTEVTGLSSWEALSGRTITERCNVKATPTATATSTAKATAKATATASAKATATSTAKATPTPDAKGCIKAVASNASLNGSDMWVTSKTGKGSVSITYDPSSSNYVVLAATDGKQAAPTFSLSWKRTVGTPWLIPGLIVGGLLVAGGVFIFMLDIQMRHQELANAQRRRRRQEEAAARLNKDPNRPLTRLELREKAQAEAAGKVWIDPRRDVPSESAADVDADRTIPAAPNPITDSRGIWAVQAAGGADRVAAAQDQVAPQEGDAVPHLPGTAFNATAFTGAPVMGSGAPVMGANPAGAPTPAAATPAAGQSAFSATSAPQAPVSGPSAASAAQASPFAPPSGANTPQARTAPIEESALSAASAAHAAVNPFAVHPGTNPFGPKYSSIFDEPASAPSPTPAAGNAALAMERSGASTDVFEPINEPVISAPSAASSSSAHSAPTPAYGQAQVDTAPTQDSAPSAASTGSTASAPSADAADAPGADATSAPTPEQADEPQREDVAKEEN